MINIVPCALLHEDKTGMLRNLLKVSEEFSDDRILMGEHNTPGPLAPRTPARRSFAAARRRRKVVSVLNSFRFSAFSRLTNIFLYFSSPRNVFGNELYYILLYNLNAIVISLYNTQRNAIRTTRDGENSL